MLKKSDDKPDLRQRITNALATLVLTAATIAVIYAGLIGAADKLPDVPQETVHMSIPSSEIVRIESEQPVLTTPSSARATVTPQDTQDRLDRYTERVESETPLHVIVEPIETAPESEPATTEESTVVETPKSGVDYYRIVEHIGDDGVRRAEIIPATDENVQQGTVETSERVFTQADIDACALTLSGETYEWEHQDKRMVMQVIINRVEKGGWGDGIIGVLTNPGQFSGYWEQHRPVSENDIEIAIEMLTAWADGAEPIHGYLYFSGGNGTKNVFK